MIEAVLNETYSRRTFFITLVGGITADIVLASRPLEPSHPYDASIQQEIEKNSDLLARFIWDYIGETTNTSGQVIRVDRARLARLILRLSYIEGGLARVDQVRRFIMETSLFLQRDNREGYGGYFYYVENQGLVIGIRGDRIVKYNINPDDADESFLHEIYHLIQCVKNPGKFSQVSLAKQLISEGYPIYVAGGFVRNTFRSEPKDKGRRRLLKLGGKAGMGIAAYKLAGNVSDTASKILEPSEMEAYVQTGTLYSGIPPVADLSPLDDLRGKLFQEVKR